MTLDTVCSHRRVREAPIGGLATEADIQPKGVVGDSGMGMEHFTRSLGSGMGLQGL